MKLTNENAFIGANVSYEKQKMVIVKINTKSVYLAKDKRFLKRWEIRPKGMTWKKFCELNEAKMVSYGLIEIDEKEADLKESFVEREKIKTSKKYLHPISEKVLEDLFKIATAKSKGQKTKSVSHIVETVKDKFAVIAYNIENKMFLIHKISGIAEYFFYDFENFDYIPFIKTEHKKGKEIIWPLQPKVNAEKKTA